MGKIQTWLVRPVDIYPNEEQLRKHTKDTEAKPCKMILDVDIQEFFKAVQSAWGECELGSKAERMLFDAMEKFESDEP